MDKWEALDWFLRRRSMALSDRCQEAEDVAIEAIEAMIGREAKVLSLEELHMVESFQYTPIDNAPVCWIEFRDEHRVKLTAPYVQGYMFDEAPEEREAYVPYMGTDWFDTPLLCEYEKTWRCWSQVPTNEQMEATAWKT